MSMEEQGGNLADETTDTEMISDSVSHQNEDLRKRRSTRIMQAVPLAVTGVDALGRPFTERTSTLIINCHGCRYQSKHYVLKNMWVTLDVPNAEPNQPPRTVRGRVAWIQRPRTVRQLFQVALELEVPGNTWGIAFPPPDWFAPQETSPYSGTQEGEHDLPARTSDPSEIHLPLTEPESVPASVQDNLRIFPAPASATDASLQLARHMARLVADAKQQIQATAREVAAQAVGAERRVSSEEWEQKVSAAREKLAQQVSSAIENIQRESETRSHAMHLAAAEALQSELPRWIAPQLEELTRNLTQQISDRAAAECVEQTQHLSASAESLRAFGQRAEETASRLRAQTEQAESQITGSTAKAKSEIADVARQNEVTANAHREALGSAANEIQQRLTTAFSSAQAHWQSQLGSDIESAQTRWQSLLENTLAAAQEKITATFEDRAHNLLSQLREESSRHTALIRDSAAAAQADAEHRVAAIRNSLEEESAQRAATLQEFSSSAAAMLDQSVRAVLSQLQEEAARQSSAARDSMASAAAETEQRASGLRASLHEDSQRLEIALARASESSDRLEELAARIETAQSQALADFQTQIDDVLTLHRNESHRISESHLEEINARIRSTFDENCQLALSKFDQQVDSIVQPHISKTEEAVHRLAGGRSLLDAALTLQQDRIRIAADDAFAESLASFRENLGGIDQLLQEAAQSVASRNLSEIESKVADLKHHTVDDLMKSAEWYEKKAQTQIQNLTEKTVEQAEGQFREKAGEVSGVFASELDHSSRSFIGHAQTQMEEVVRDAFEHSRALFAEAAETTTAAFTDEIQRQARQELDGFGEEAQRSLSDTRALLDTARADATQRVTAEQEAFLRQFHTAMTSAMERGVGDANARVKAGLAPLLDSWKSTVEAHTTEMRSIYSQMSNEAADQHRSRLENVSNQWMLATVATLDHQSRAAISSIAGKAEETLRETCAQVFAGVGDALRERLQQIAASLAPPEPSKTRSQTAGGNDR
ncbi:MAG: hypothetical protein WBD19_04175 [Candidatus Acidiferrum sp.]